MITATAAQETFTNVPFLTHCVIVKSRPESAYVSAVSVPLPYPTPPSRRLCPTAGPEGGDDAAGHHRHARNPRQRHSRLLRFAGGLRRSEIVGLDVGRDQREDGRRFIEVLDKDRPASTSPSRLAVGRYTVACDRLRYQRKRSNLFPRPAPSTGPDQSSSPAGTSIGSRTAERIVRLPTWFAGPTSPSLSMRSTSEAALL